MTFMLDMIFAGIDTSMVFALNLVTARDEKYFKKGNEFIPERWMRDRPLGSIHPYAALPFSHGTRMCIGRRIAEQEMYTFIARVMHRLTLTTIPRHGNYIETCGCSFRASEI
ncbi:Sterol 26-hydroxylase, mitochondrial [Armadillidium vulgare]|nr:Sterol 26-hydroxylase, mitochondrial [Armadillidium vulgare]